MTILAFRGSCRYAPFIPAVTLNAHFDGKQIVLDEPFDLPANSKLMVTILPTEDLTEDAEWQNLAADSLSSDYGENEPDYPPGDVRQ